MTLLGNLEARADACFLCKWIAADIKRHGHLTDWSPADGALPLGNTFPRGGKILHIKLEKFTFPLDSMTESHILSVD